MRPESTPRRKLSLKIRTKYLLIASLLAFTTAVAVGLVNYRMIEQLTLERSINKLEVEARLLAPPIAGAFSKLAQDVVSISRMPPFKGLARSIANQGLDPNDASTTDQWMRRLETIFRSVLQVRPEYTQMRFIDNSAGAQELVRVNQGPDGTIQVITADQLQKKRPRNYIRQSQDLQPGQVRFFGIDYNIDNGVVDPTQPTLRAITPVQDDRGNLFGFMIVNAHYGRMLADALADIHSSADLYIVDGNGTHIHRSPTGEISPVLLGADAAAFLPEPVRKALARADGGEGSFSVETGEVIVSVARVNTPGTAERNLKTVLLEPRDQVLQSAHATQNHVVLIGIGLVVAASAIAFATSGLITRPMEEMTSKLRKFSPESDGSELPTDRNDEIGDMSRAFSDLIGRLQQLRATQTATVNRLQSILDNTADAMISTDSSGKIVEFNKGAETMTGYARHEILGSNIRTLVFAGNDTDIDDAAVADYLKTGGGKPHGTLSEIRIRTRDGTVLPIELCISEVELEDTKIYSGILRDISERKAMEHAIRRHARDLERSNSELEEFAYIASHDLKEPLRGISNHVQFLKEDHGDAIGDDGQKRIARITELCVRSDQLINDLLKFSRLNLAEFTSETVDLEEVVDNIRNHLADTLAEQNATIHIHSPLPRVQGDKSRVTSLVQNLILNGIRYNDSATKRIDIGFDDQAGGRFYVQDNGIGIAPEFRDNIFKIFKRLNSEKAYGPGSGMGLSLARKIVERHGGRLWCEPAENNGSIFYFQLPGRQQ